MLYQDKTLGRPSIVVRIASTFRAVFSTQRHADLDLLSTNAHLRRDLGLHEGGGFTSGDIFRK